MTVVVGYVPTPEGETALDHAIEEARTRKARLLVVNTSKGDALVDQRYADDAQVEGLRARLVREDVDHELLHSIGGREASEEIVRVAEEHRAELVVIGLRRRTPVGKLLMGSTAQRVLLDAACPVLAVKGPR